jgi:formylglycine-generating enzyme required for sulfatase activity
MEPQTQPRLALPDLDLILVEGGQFLMGDDKSEFDNQKPAHRVEVSSFYMAKYPVTQRLYEAVMGKNPSNFKGTMRPVEMVSWEDAQAFIKKLNGLKDVGEFLRLLSPPGEAFRMPTEAEWEYAARGGRYSEGYLYAGSDGLKQVGWYKENSGGETKEVGLLLGNELGLHDMSGNVWEWCEDWYGGSEYYEECRKKGIVKDPAGPDRGDHRVYRGGSWFSDAPNCRVARRGYDWYLGYRTFNLGFRLVLSVPSV